MNNRNFNTPTVFVLFGGTGDLARKKLVPALVDLFAGGRLPERFRVVGFSRKDFSHEDYRAFMRDVIATKEHNHGKETVDVFLRNVYYCQGDFDALKTYQTLHAFLDELDADIGQCTNTLLYLAVPPKFYAIIFENLSKSGLSQSCGHEERKRDETHGGWTRVLVEKPFGRDFRTAQELEQKLCAVFADEQIFRIDHYLAKDAIQNILTFRFSNVLFESSWNKEYIKRVHIKLFGTDGVEERGEFFDPVGELRDVGQNHMLQMLALTTMENPHELRAKRLRAERAKVLARLRAFKEEEQPAHVVRGQYEGYRDIRDVPADSDTETYFLLKAFVDSERWSGVPFYLESGKKLSRKEVAISVVFRPQLPCLCGREDPHEHYNTLTVAIQPTHKITMRFWAKKPGLSYALEAQDLVFESKDGEHNDAYEKVLYDCVVGDQTLFTSGDEVRAAWKFITPILEGWGSVPLVPYAPGSDGPASALKSEITSTH